MRIGILTGGGDVPGLNACIKALVNRGRSRRGIEVLGIRRVGMGFWPSTLTIPRRRSMSILWTSSLYGPLTGPEGPFSTPRRTNPGRVYPSQAPDFLRPNGAIDDSEPLDFTRHILKSLDGLGHDALIPLGGEDTLGYAARIHGEGFPVVSIPKTMDNDVFGTDYCIGFSTAVTRAVKFIQQLRSTFGSHERIGVVELFGRHSGQTCLVSAHLAGADRALIAEVPFDITKLADLLLQDKGSNPSRYAVLAVSEGAHETGRTGPTRRQARPLRTPEARRYRSGRRREAREHSRPQDHVPRVGLPHAIRSARCPRRDGGCQLRQYRPRLDSKEEDGPNGGAQRWEVHHVVRRVSDPGSQDRRCRCALQL